MKNKLLPSFHYRPSVGGLLFSLALFLCASASAQNLLKNGDFESPFPVSDPTAGWALFFFDGKGGPGDFAIIGQSTEASAGKGGRGLHFRANHPGPAWAYFKQVVTNLTPDQRYTLSCPKMKTGDANHDDKISIYMAAVSGSSSNVVFGNATSNGPYSMSVTCSASRQIDVELHFHKLMMPTLDTADDFKSSECWAHFDEFSLTLTP